LGKILRAGTLETFNHLVRKTPNIPKCEILGYAEGIVVIYAFGRGLLFCYVAGIE
jgi:hypothetical protein